jgi:hypothetical protein
MIVSKELVISNRKKVDIIEELRQKKFRPFPKMARQNPQEKPRTPKRVPLMRPRR